MANPYATERWLRARLAELNALISALRPVRDEIHEGAQFDKRWEDVLTALDAAIASLSRK